MRLFVGIELPGEAREQLYNYHLRPEWLGIDEPLRWIRSDNLHVTLKFLGEVADARGGDIADALRQVEWPASVRLRVEGAMFLPPRGPASVFVALLGGDLERLNSLHGAVEGVLEPLGFPHDGRAYVPHVTLARVDRRKRWLGRKLREYHPPAPGAVFISDSYALLQSQRGIGGPVYIPLARFAG